MWSWLSENMGSSLGFGSSAGMITKEQLLRFCKTNLELLEKPEVKRRIADHVKAGEQAAEMTTKIQEEIFGSMGIEPSFGISCLGRVGTVFKDDREVMMTFMELVGREELACDEAERPDDFRKKMELMQKMREQQAAMAEHLKAKNPEEGLAFGQAMQRHMQQARLHNEATGDSILTPQQQMQFFQQQYAQQQPSNTELHKALGHRNPLLMGGLLIGRQIQAMWCKDEKIDI